MSPSDEAVVSTPCKGDIDSTLTEKFRKALQEFGVPEESELRDKGEDSIRQHPSEEVEAYFEWATHHGKPILPWSIIQPAFTWKVKFVMDEMLRLDQARLKDGETLNVGEESPLKMGYNFIIERSQEFEGAPFTWQRICELLHSPMRHYKNAEKFFRALDKTINVVTTVTEMGIRVSGAEWPMPSDSSSGKVEQHFFGKVDELDGEPLAGDATVVSIVETIAISDNIVGPVLLSCVNAAGDASATETATDEEVNGIASGGDQPIDMCTRKEDADEDSTEQEPKDEPMEEPKQETKEEPMDETKEESIEEPMEQPVDELKADPVEVPMGDPIEEIKEESVEEPKESMESMEE